MKTRSQPEERAEKRQLWEQHTRNWKGSGQAQSEYFRRHNLRENQLTYWKRKFQPTASPISLVELRLDTALQSRSSAKPAPLFWEERTGYSQVIQTVLTLARPYSV